VDRVERNILRNGIQKKNGMNTLMARPKKLNDPVKMDFWADKKIKTLFESKFYDAKKDDTSLTIGEFFGIIVKRFSDGTDAVK